MALIYRGRMTMGSCLVQGQDLADVKLCPLSYQQTIVHLETVISAVNHPQSCMGFPLGTAVSD